MINKEYDNFLSIIFHWAETKRTHTTVRFYSVRKEKYEDNEFYVFGIGVSDFLESDGYNPKNDPVLVDFKPYGFTQIDMIGIAKMLCGSSWFALSDFTELDKLLKDAGAPEVYLHPSVWEYNGHEHYRNDELLIVIPKKKDENES